MASKFNEAKLPDGNAITPPLTASAAPAGPRSKVTPFHTSVEPSRFSEYAYPPPSSPPFVTGDPLLKTPATLYPGCRLTGVPAPVEMV